MFFILLPVCLSLIVTPSQLSNLLHGTLLYNVLTIGLELIYFGGITGILFLIHTPGFGLLFFYHAPPVAMIIVVTTTLAWAVILAPVHSYAQALIDQRFNRRHYEAARAVEAFTSTLREEINLDKVCDGLLVVVQKTMQPQSVSVWARKAVQQNAENAQPSSGWDESPERTRHEKHEQAMQAPVAEKSGSTEHTEFAVANDDSLLAQVLRTAQYIQHSLLPEDAPLLPGWHIVPYYQPAREVGGDFYDFLLFEDGRLGIVIGDVTDKGVPAALVMATTHTMLHAEIPPKMFVTCFYAILDPDNGLMRYANAGHDLPFRSLRGSVSEVWATGMPLGLMPGMRYEEYEVTLAPGESLLFYTDGLVEAHNHSREMFSFPRLKVLLEEYVDGASLVSILLNELKSFTGEGWEQEDDVTMVTLQRSSETHTMNTQQGKSSIKVAGADV